MYGRDIRIACMALLAEGRSLNSISRERGVSRSVLREWRDRGIEPKRSVSTCFVCSGGDSDRAAYAALFGFYLGDGCISRQRSTYALRVFCDRTLPGIVGDVSRLVETVHDGGKVCRVPAPGVTVVQNCWNHWPHVFPQHGPGHKHERKLVLEDWQRGIIREEPAAFLRGLFHSDGCRVNNWATRMVAGQKKRYDYPRWQFTNHSGDIQQWCKDSLDQLGIPWRQSSWKVVSVSRREAVRTLDELIGPKS